MLQYLLWKGNVVSIDHNLKKLHTVFTGSIAPGITLTCVKTDKFKTGCLSVNLVGKLSRDTAASFALLPRVLRRGSSELPDMERIEAALDDLYGARVEPIVRKKGELHCIGFYADFPDDRFIPGGGSVLEKTVNLICGILLSPDMRDGLIRSDYIESEKKNLVDDIRAGINDKRGYSLDRLIEEMCAGEAYGVNRLGDENGVVAITPEFLTDIYHNALSNLRMEIIYCGSAEPDRIASLLRRSLVSLPGRVDTEIPKTQVILYPDKAPPRRFTETLDVTQSKLAVGFRLGKAMKDIPDYPALMVLNTLYGAGDTSKLFLNVRERLSLCYYVNSMIEMHKGVMVVASGVAFSSYEPALDEILAQLGQIKNGEVSEQELIAAKRAVVTAIKSAMDRPAGLVELYFDSLVAAARYDPVELYDEVDNVALDRIVETAAEIEPDSIYLLASKGGDDIDT